MDDYITLNLKQNDVMGSRERDALRGEVAGHFPVRKELHHSLMPKPEIYMARSIAVEAVAKTGGRLNTLLARLHLTNHAMCISDEGFFIATTLAKIIKLM